MKNYFLIIFLAFNFCFGQQNEKFEVYIIKGTKLENGIEVRKDIFIDTLGVVKNNINSETFKIDAAKFNESINTFLSNENFERHEADTYNNRMIFTSSLPGVNINISITKLSDLKKITKTDKAYYSYYKFYPNEENNNKREIEYDIERFLNLPEFIRLKELLH
jgi:hypothetical protein